MKRCRVLLPLALGLAGCNPYLQGTAGYSSAIAGRVNGQRGAEANIHAGVDIVEGKNDEDRNTVAFATGINIRTRFTERVQQVALGHEGMLRYFLHTESPEPRWLPCASDGVAARAIAPSAPSGDPDSPASSGCRVADYPAITPMEMYLRAGASAFTVGAQDTRFVAGMTQFIEYGFVMMVGAEDVPYLTLGAVLENDTRFDGRPGPVSLSFLFGVGYLKVKTFSAGGGLFMGL